MSDKKVPLQTILTKEERKQFVDLCETTGISASSKIRMFVISELKKDKESK